MNRQSWASSRLGIGLLLLLLLGGTIVVVRLASRRGPATSESLLTPISLDGVRRLLILAPHCDDETLGSGGLIQSAVRAGIQIQVVIATNGDGYVFSTLEEFHKLYPTARDYIRMGEVRQGESLDALAVLGVPADNVRFLGYPDRGTSALWERYWSTLQPYRSPYSRADHSPYPRTYNPKSVYAGNDYLADLVSIIQDYRPDMVVFPHAEDVHPDHWGLNAFTRLALTEISHRDIAYQPTQLVYLVHRPDYPVVRGLKPTAGLVPPPALFAIYPDWLTWNLSPAEIAGKGQAVLAYRSQLGLLRGFMASFVRANELFSAVTAANLPAVVAGEPLNPASWRDSSGNVVGPVQQDPTGDVLSRKSVPETDLKAVYSAEAPGGGVWLCAELRDAASREITYSLRLKSLTEGSIDSFEAQTKPRRGQTGLAPSGAYLCTQTSLEALGNPWAFFIGASVDSPDPNLPLDQTAWQLVYVRY